MAERVFRARSLTFEEIELLFSKGELCLGLGLLDPAVAWIQEAADRLDTTTSQLTDSEKASLDIYTRDNRFRITNRLVLAINDELRDEGGSDSQMRQWIDKRDSLLRLLESLAKDDLAKSILVETRQKIHISDAGVKVARARGLPQLTAAVSEARQDAKTFPNGDMFLISLLGSVADNLPEVKPELHKLLERLHPIADLKEYQKNIHLPGSDFRVEGAKAERAKNILSVAVSAALAVEDYDLLSDWSKQLGQIAQESADPSTAGMQAAMSKLLEAKIALRKTDAQTASRLFREVLKTPGILSPARSSLGQSVYLPLLQQVSTVELCLASLVESEALEQNSEDSLLNSERLRIAELRNNWLHTLFADTQPEMAELAMLVRKAALAGGLSAAEATRKENLQAKLPSPNSQVIKAPEQADLHEFCNRLPANMSVMTYFMGPSRVIGWKITHVGVQVKILDVTSLQLVRRREQMLQGLINQDGEWQANAVELYRSLLLPFEPFNDDASLVIVSNPATADVPIEVLGADAANPLVNRTRIVYAAELALNKQKTKAPYVAVEKTPALVVGINGIGLKQAEAEARTVAQLLKTEPVIGVDATKAHVFEQAPHVRWLHLATHSHIDAANPFRSSMELADGGVEAWELLTLASEADTVVLSGCSTNRPPGFRTAGLLGNSAALASFAMAAKPRWIVATLWGVHDDSTQALIERFYRGVLVNCSAYPQALQGAKQSMLKEKSPPPANRWAPIVVLARDPWIVAEEN
jgi:CHAT domain-containing protein